MKSKTIVYEQKQSKNRFKKTIKGLINKIEKIKYMTIFKAMVGLMVTLVCVKWAYGQRGYYALGGEFLVVPTVLILKEIIRELLEIKKGDKDAE